MKLKLLILSLGISLSASAQSALEIVEKAENKLRGDQSYSEMSMTIVRPGGNVPYA